MHLSRSICRMGRLPSCLHGPRYHTASRLLSFSKAACAQRRSCQRRQDSILRGDQFATRWRRVLFLVVLRVVQISPMRIQKMEQVAF